MSVDKTKIKWTEKWLDDKSGYWIETETPFGPMYVDCWDESKRYVAHCEGYLKEDEDEIDLGTKTTLEAAKTLIYKYIEKRVKEVDKYSNKVWR